MLATLQIRQLEDAVYIRVKEGSSLWRILGNLSSLLVTIFVLRLAANLTRIQVFLVATLCVWMLLKNAYSALRGTEAELRVSNLDLISTGHAVGHYTPCVISRADIYRLEYRDRLENEGEEHPQGLYAVYRGDLIREANACLLPCINAHQTEQAIQVVLSRFPDTGSLPLPDTHASDFITLNLNMRDRE